MPSVKEIQRKLAAFDRTARTAGSQDAYKSAWKRIFKQDLSDASAKSFERYYKKMRSSRGTRRKQRGGAAYTMAPAPAHFPQMTPGLYVEQYGKFPIAADTDPSSIKDMDVYFGDSLPRSPAGYWPSVPANMGSNKVGGARRRTRRGRRAHKRTRRASRQRGGNLLDSLAMRPIPFISTPYPNVIQSASNAWSGGTTPIPAPASPVSHTWELRGQQGTAINPGLVANIDSSFQRLASPAPWQTSN